MVTVTDTNTISENIGWYIWVTVFCKNPYAEDLGEYWYRVAGEAG